MELLLVQNEEGDDKVNDDQDYGDEEEQKEGNCNSET
jgi:hypothetical protein